MAKPNAPATSANRARRPAAPVVDTERLLLRCPEPADLAARMPITGDAETMRFIGGVQDEAENWARILRYAGHFAFFGYGVFAVVERSSGDLIGEIGLGHFARGLGSDFDDAVEAAWLVRRQSAGRGYAAEALAAVLAWHEGRFGAARIVCMIAPDNAASLRLADKMGFARFRDALYRMQPVYLLARPARFPGIG
jgi:RimJ/RimL family protein N-acetyltransferase